MYDLVLFFFPLSFKLGMLDMRLGVVDMFALEMTDREWLVSGVYVYRTCAFILFCFLGMRVLGGLYDSKRGLEYYLYE